jgi:hypothetical protein
MLLPMSRHCPSPMPSFATAAPQRRLPIVQQCSLSASRAHVAEDAKSAQLYQPRISTQSFLLQLPIG